MLGGAAALDRVVDLDDAELLRPAEVSGDRADRAVEFAGGGDGAQRAVSAHQTKDAAACGMAQRLGPCRVGLGEAEDRLGDLGVGQSPSTTVADQFGSDVLDSS